MNLLIAAEREAQVMRKRFGLGLVVLCCGSVGATPAIASDGGGSDGPADFAVGSAKNRLAQFTPFPFNLEVSAHRQATGEVTGHVRGYGEIPLAGEFWVEGEVTCVRVEPKPAAEVALTGIPGTRASIKYRFKTRRGPGAPPEGGVQVFIEDNGNPEMGQPVDGNATNPPEPTAVFEANAANCDSPQAQLYNPVDQGNYTVHDGTTP